MKTIGNIIWCIFGGLTMGLTWFLFGILFSITIVGIPVAKQCFKLAAFSFFPFGKEIEYGGKSVSFILNILWIAFCGWELAVEAVTIGLLFSITIIGIPFGKQCFKLAKLSLMPFGTTVKKVSVQE